MSHIFMKNVKYIKIYLQLDVAYSMWYSMTYSASGHRKLSVVVDGPMPAAG